MPIVNYKKKAKNSIEWFFEQDDISDTNKEYVDEFLDAYDVSPARISLFMKHIACLLRETDDIKDTMQDRKAVNKIFKMFRDDDNIGRSYYATIINVSIRFTKWLNEGQKPKGFVDIKNTSKKKQKRNLKPSDMITWEDGKKIIEETNSTQIKAAFMLQLDAGLRPSEFIDLNYGDVKIDEDLIILKVRRGKTGGRNVILHRSVPYVLRWHSNHPTKKDDDPLWVTENPRKSHRKDGKKAPQRYNYHALRKRVLTMADNAKVDKPMDFYNLRHSSCYLDKLDNLPTELAAKRHGHSVEFFTETYGRLSAKDEADRFRQHYGTSGTKEEKRKPVENQVCVRCEHVNEPETENCEKCGAVLSLKTAVEKESEREQRLSKMEETIQAMRSQMKSLNTEFSEENTMKVE